MESKMHVRDLAKEEEPEFLSLTGDYIGRDYDDIDASFAQNILDSDRRGHDAYGYFTLRKKIFVADVDGRMAGFLVSSEKRGGSVKFGPLIIKPEYQRSGLGYALWNSVADIYGKKGFRKAYCDAGAHRVDIFNLHAKLRLTIEAYLKEQYKPGIDEIVSSRFLQDVRPLVEFKRQVWVGQNTDFSVKVLESQHYDGLERLILAEMPKFYDGIDKSFVNSIIAAQKRFQDSFRKKGKQVFISESNGHVVGAVVATPKRGGSVKLVPFLLSPEFGSTFMAKGILSFTEEYFSERGSRKLYTIVPVQCSDTIESLYESGYLAEGLLRSPYKSGVDQVFLGKFL